MIINVIFKCENFALMMDSFSLEAILNWINNQISSNFLITSFSFILMGLAARVLFGIRTNMDFLHNKTLWGTVSLYFCFVMISGQMWNHMRQARFLYVDEDDEIIYVHGSHQMQFVFESYLVMISYAAITVGIIILIEAAKCKLQPVEKNLLVTLGLSLVIFFFGLLLFVVQLKLSFRNIIV